MLELDRDRFKDPTDQRWWQDIPHTLRLLIPDRYKPGIEMADTPIKLLNILKNKFTAKQVENTIARMKKNMSTMVDDFSKLALYTQFMVSVEQINSVSDIKSWKNLPISLDIVKARLSSVKELHQEIRSQLSSNDKDFSEMCGRISDIDLSSYSMQLNTISARENRDYSYRPRHREQSPKNESGLVRARPTFHPYSREKYTTDRTKDAESESHREYRSGRNRNGKGSRPTYKGRSGKGNPGAETCRFSECQISPHQIDQCPVRANYQCRRRVCEQAVPHLRKDCQYQSLQNDTRENNRRQNDRQSDRRNSQYQSKGSRARTENQETNERKMIQQLQQEIAQIKQQMSNGNATTSS
jgi:hypothetical protein